MNRIIKQLKNLRKQSYLKLEYQHKYAFVGIGNHSINNLYPIINYLRVPLKYIVVSSASNAALVDKNFEGVQGTNDLDKVLQDPEIKGIFISADPNSHFSLVKQALSHDKCVFVEKPPCKTETELQELVALEKNHKGFCLVGMQKRYSPVLNALMEVKKEQIISYNYRFVTGPYPEGDKILDVFIHPLDLIAYLFGDFKIGSIQSANKNTYFIHLVHNGFIGSIELSTDYSWKNAEEDLVLNTENGIYAMKNMDLLTFVKKSKTLFSIPIEKIKKTNTNIEVLFNRNNFNPIQENNQLFTTGTHDEIKNFIGLCENNKGKNKSALSTMTLTYQLIQQLKK